jgi:hypothetical protein
LGKANVQETSAQLRCQLGGNFNLELWSYSGNTFVGCVIENMYVYYEIAKVQAYAITTAIHLVVRLLLRGADRVMTPYF